FQLLSAARTLLTSPTRRSSDLVISNGQLSTGSSVSVTVMICVCVAVLPHASVAVQVLSIVPQPSTTLLVSPSNVTVTSLSQLSVDLTSTTLDSGQESMFDSACS